VVEAMFRVTLWGLAGLPKRFRKRSSAPAVEPAARA
jgi:dolichol-phosphate mannosyltransferase